MKNLEQKLAFLLLGQAGGENRSKIIELLKDRPYNINQIANELSLNYMTVKYHVNKLIENNILISSKYGDYGKVYFLNELLENNFEVYEDIVNKRNRLTASPVLLQNLLKQSDVAFIMTDEDGKTMFWNSGAEEIFRCCEKDVLGTKLGIFESEEFLENLFEEVDEEGKTIRETKIGGEPLYVRVIAESVLNEKGDFIGYSLLALDITKRKESEKEKEKQYNVLQTVMNNTDSQLVYFDRDFNFVYVNSAYANGAGYSKEELRGKNHFDLFPNEENEKIFEKVRDTGETVSFKDKPFEFPNDNERGVTYWNWTLSPVKDDDGEVQGLVLSLIETTDRVEYEQEIEEAYERIEFLNTLIESIKDVNQLMVKTDDFEKVIREVPSILLGTKGFIDITVCMFNEDGVMSPFSSEGIHEVGQWEMTFDGGEGPGCIREAVDTKGEVIVDTVKSYCEECPLLHDNEEHRTAVIPMKEDEKVVGVIRACYEPKVEIDERTLELLREVADDLVYALESK
ncbi:MAG: PAS domain S-box protein [Thermoplasmatota archaeon]